MVGLARWVWIRVLVLVCVGVSVRLGRGWFVVVGGGGGEEVGMHVDGGLEAFGGGVNSLEEGCLEGPIHIADVLPQPPHQLRRLPRRLLYLRPEHYPQFVRRLCI